MQNSLERLFEGLATSLREDVAPAVEDPYAKAAGERRDRAAREPRRPRRVARRPPARGDRADPVRCSTTAGARPAVLDEPIPTDGAALVASRAAHLDALAHADADEAALHEFLSWQVERELGLLRTGMYK